MTDLATRLETLTPERQALLRRLLAQRTPADDRRIRPRDPATAAPASDAQYQLWITDQIGQGGARYNVPYAVRIRGPVDLDTLAAALAGTRRRHQVLRTSLRRQGDALLQVVDPDPSVPLRTVDLTAAPADQRLTRAVELAAADAALPIDLGAESVLRATVYRLADDDVLLLVVVHHIATDAWSAGIFVRELLAGYRAASGAGHPLPEPELQYADYAAWQQSPAHQQDITRQLGYWRRVLSDLPDPVDLPADHPRRPAAQDRRGGRVLTVLDAGLVDRVRARAAACEATLSNVLYAAVGILLSRYTGVQDLVLGTSVANRGSVEIEELIGYFANTLPLRLDLTGGPTLAEAVTRARDAMRGMADHQDVPFARLVAEVLPDRDPDHSPLFQVMVVFQNVPPQQLASDGLELEPVEVHNASAKFDLDISVTEREREVVVGIEYDADLYSPERVRRLLGHLEQLLAQIADRPEALLAEAELLTVDERATITDSWNATSAPFPDACLHQLFEQWADRAPDAPAVRLGERAWSYREVEQQANQVAARLRAHGVGPGVRVGMAAERGLELVTGMLAIAKAGGAYLPLDPAYPQDRLEFMLQDGDVRVLLCQPHLRGHLPPVDVPVVLLEAEPAPGPATRPDSGVTPTDLAYVIYTSGSTGRPKGVLADHRGRVSNFHDFNTRFGVGPGDRLLGLSSLSFDMCAYDVFGTLAAGACLVLPEQRRLRDPRHWAELMREQAITVWHSVPALLGLLVDHLERVPGPELACRVVLLGGDWIPLDLPDRIRAAAPAAQVVSLGGATEVSMDSTVHLVGAVDPGWQSIPYGAPLANQLAYVLDPDGRLLPEGVPGELALGGVGVAWGYHGRPALTAEKFAPNPYSGRLGDRLYRTGDLARWRSDGTLELIGRIDTQVKIRGYRVELGEIAAAHRDHPAVAEAVVLARKQGGSHRLVAYLVLEPGRTGADIEDLPAALAARLPEYMVPSAHVVLERLPLTPNGKIDRKALAAAELPQAAGQDLPYAAPAAGTEQLLAGLWAELLGLTEVSAHANFFALGGDSVGAIQLVSRAGEHGLELTARQVFEQQTLSALAAAVDAAADADPAAPAAAAGSTDLPSPMQRRMLAAQRDGHFPGLYVIRSAIPLPGDLDEQAFTAAWQLLIDRHEALRLRFPSTAEAAGRFAVGTGDRPDLLVYDWRGLGEAEQEERTRALIDTECATLTPDSDSLLRLRLLRLDDSCTLFLQFNHYLLLDGWSTGVLTSELLAAYGALAAGAEPALAPAPPLRPYLDWCAAQDPAATDRYWRARLADLAAPTPLLDGSWTCSAGYAKLTVPLGAARLEALRSVAVGERLTTGSLLLAAWASLLAARNGGAEEVLFGVTTASRPAAVAEVESVAGLLVNVLPLRLRIDPAATWRELAREVQHRQLDDAEHPLLTPEVLAELPTARYDHVLVFDNYPVDDTVRLSAEALRSGHPVAQADWNVNQMELPLRVDVALGSGDALILSYDPSSTDPAELLAFTAELLEALDRLSADPGSPVRCTPSF